MDRPSRHHENRPARQVLAHTQNFLTSRRLVARLVERAGIGRNDLVLEIGPGRGIITEALERRAGRVIAVEKDPGLAARLRRLFAGNPRVTIQTADFFDVALPRQPFKMVASLPFDRTSAIVTRLLAAACPPDDLHLIVQREAAERFGGHPRESLVAVLLKPWFEPTVVQWFRRHDFTPTPGVDVVMLRLHKRSPPLVDGADAQLFRDFVSYGFTAWQPSLASAVERIVGRSRGKQIIREIGLATDAPPGLVPFEVWLRLFQVLVSTDRAGLRVRLAGSEQRLRQQQQGLSRIHRTRARRPRRPPPNVRSGTERRAG